jgi:hypothetical protein
MSEYKDKLTDQEFSSIKKLVSDYDSIKIQLGDTVIAQHSLMSKLEGVKNAYNSIESGLIETYGPDAVFNMETGEIKQK